VQAYGRRTILVQSCAPNGACVGQFFPLNIRAIKLRRLHIPIFSHRRARSFTNDNFLRQAAAWPVPLCASKCGFCIFSRIPCLRD
jgi:hypothetical protein